MTMQPVPTSREMARKIAKNPFYMAGNRLHQLGLKGIIPLSAYDAYVDGFADCYMREDPEDIQYELDQLLIWAQDVCDLAEEAEKLGGRIDGGLR